MNASLAPASRYNALLPLCRVTTRRAAGDMPCSPYMCQNRATRLSRY